MSQLLVSGGTILTQEPGNPVARAMLIEDGVVIATGDDEEVAGQARAGAERLELGGRFACPGFIDAHNHFSFCTVAELALDCRTPPMRSVDQMLAELEELAARTPAARWVLGWGYNEVFLVPSRHPTLAELDRIAPQNPLVIGHQSGHMCAVNTIALEAAGISDSTPNPLNGVIDRDRSGRLTGILHEHAAEMVGVVARKEIMSADPESTRRAAYGLARRYAALGLTSLCDPCVSRELEPLYDELNRDPEFPLLILGLGMGKDGLFAPPLDRLEDRPAEGEDGFGVSGVKLFADGGEQCAVCMSKRGAVRMALRVVHSSIRHRTLMPLKLATAPVSRLERDGKVHSGIKFYGDGQLAGLLERAVGHGLAAAVHAMGNEAIDQVIGGIESARRRAPDDATFRIEHVMMPAEESLTRMEGLGIAGVVQPRFVNDFGQPLILTGTNRELRVLPFRDLMDRGVVLAGSSDAPVCDAAVLPAIQSAVTRRTAQGEVLDRDQALSVDEALTMYTRNAADVLGLGESHGSLARGRAADFVVLDADPRAVDPQLIGRIQVEETYRAGRRVHPLGSR
jgi:predicted amidohydrolase YtcJ